MQSLNNSSLFDNLNSDGDGDDKGLDLMDFEDNIRSSMHITSNTPKANKMGELGLRRHDSGSMQTPSMMK
jgi:hypothetical protein